MKNFCVYLTIYSGNKMPPFYIGYSSVLKIQNGYHGTVKSKKYSKIWKNEIRENNHLFKTKIVSYCQSVNDAKLKETNFQKIFNVHKNPMYINQAIQGEKFYREKGEYRHSKETKEKIGKSNSISLKGNVPYNKGVSMKEEQKKKLSEINTGKKMSEETKLKISESMKGRAPKTNKEITEKAKATRKRNVEQGVYSWPNQGKKMSEETKQKIRNSLLKRKLSNDCQL